MGCRVPSWGPGMAQRTDNAARSPAARLYLTGRPTDRQVLGSDWQVGRWPDMVPHAPRASVELTPVLHLNSALPQCIPSRVVRIVITHLFLVVLSVPVHVKPVPCTLNLLVHNFNT